MRHGRAKFLHYFPKGFRDPLYEDWERGYKWAAHERWIETLGQESFRKLLRAGKHREIAAQAVAIEARTNLLFSFEKMALRDGIQAARPTSRARVDELNSRPIAPPPLSRQTDRYQRRNGGPQNRRFPSPKLRLLELPKIPRH